MDSSYSYLLVSFLKVAEAAEAAEADFVSFLLFHDLEFFFRFLVIRDLDFVNSFCMYFGRSFFEYLKNTIPEGCEGCEG